MPARVVDGEAVCECVQVRFQTQGLSGFGMGVCGCVPSQTPVPWYHSTPLYIHLRNRPVNSLVGHLGTVCFTPSAFRCISLDALLDRYSRES